MTFTLPIGASPQMKLATDSVDGANVGNVSRMTANLAKDFMYKAVTPSLSFGPHTSSGFSTFLDALFKTVSRMALTIEEVAEGPNTVWIYANEKSTINATGAAYDDVYMLMFRFAPSADDSPPQIVRLLEMFDNKLVLDVIVGALQDSKKAIEG